MKNIILFNVFLSLIWSSVSSQWRFSSPVGTGRIRTLISNQRTLLAGVDSAGIFSSSNGGLTWVSSNAGLAAHWFNYELHIGTAGIFLATDIGVYLSTDNGVTWNNRNNGIQGRVSSFASTPNFIFAGTDNAGVFRSIDNGSNWTPVQNGPSGTILSLVSSGPNLVVGTCGVGRGVFVSTDMGDTWSLTLDHWPSPGGGQSDICVAYLCSDSQRLFASCEIVAHNLVITSTNHGISWTLASYTQGIGCLATTDYGVFMGGGQAWISRDTGVTWVGVSDGLPLGNRVVKAFAQRGDTLFLAFSGEGFWNSQEGVYWRSFPEFITRIGESGDQLPAKATLFQNYPNPFNGETVIRYSLPRSTLATIDIFDVLGRRVSTLVDTHQNAGDHHAVVNANILSTGIYFYRLTAGAISQTKKFMLLR